MPNAIYKKSRNNRNFRYSKPRNRSRNNKSYIDPSKFIKKAKPVNEKTYEPNNLFSDFDFHSVIHTNLQSNGYVKPSPIQDQTLHLSLAGNDIVGIADTGTGKTAAFVLPVLNKLLSDTSNKAIVIAPTRELALQIEQEFKALGKNSRLFGAVLIGGTPIGPQIKDLRNRPNVIIGTPGRIKDHLERGSLKLSSFNMVVLDEVDRMLDMGFVDDIKQILGQVHESSQSFYFSATLDRRVNAIIDGFLSNPSKITISSNRSSDNVEQDVINYSGKDDQLNKLHDLLISSKNIKPIIFSDTQRNVEKLSKDLVNRGFSSESIHGGKSQGQRQTVLNKFKKSSVDILVATDVAARGIDISDITHVINYSTPESYSDYIHRIGRTGRAGKKGYAFTFVQR